MDTPVHIPFKNHQNPNATFDLVSLEALLDRTDLDHSPFQLHLVEFYLIIFIEEGEGKHTIDFKEYVCETGTLLTVRKDQVHRFHKHSDLKGNMLLFTNEFLVSYLDNLELQKTLQLFNELLGTPQIHLTESEFNSIQALIKRIQKEYFEVNDAYSLSIIRSELHILITQLFRIKSNVNQVLFDRKYLTEFTELQTLVENNANKTTRVQDYAQMMGRSSKTLNNITQSILSKSAKEFVDEICIKQIKRLLINTVMSVKEIAYRSGFEETTNFYKYFKRHTQLTPEQFRDSHK